MWDIKTKSGSGVEQVDQDKYYLNHVGYKASFKDIALSCLVPVLSEPCGI